MENIIKSDENIAQPLLIEEFEIVELEDRLELAGRCNGSCGSEVAED
jgi:hypothetical protein